MNQKNTIQTPFSLCDQILGPYMFSQTNRMSLSEKMDLYFQDFSFVPLFIQVRPYPSRPNS
jgi:replication factor C subunit 1